jgi:hypothetical protein
LEPGELKWYLGAYAIPGSSVFDSWFASLPLPQPLEELATRQELSIWLTRLFLSLALPPPSAPVPMRIPQPLALNAFVKTIQKLHEVGYPSHWLSGVLEDLLTDRAVLHGPLPWDKRLPVVIAQHKQQPTDLKTRLYLAPYRAELETAVATAQAFLPFAISLPAASRLPEPHRIARYTAIIGPDAACYFVDDYRFDDLNALASNASCVALAFAPSPVQFRSIGKLYDWVCGGSDRAKLANDLILVQGLTYDSHTGVTSWWMDSSRVSAMRENKWVMGLVRLDGWGPLGRIYPFKAKEVERWAECQ